MGYWQIIHFMIFFALKVNVVHGETRPQSLDNLLRNYANTTLSKHRTGYLYKVGLPSKFSGMEVSVIRLRSSTFWARGANFSYFNVTQKSIPTPYTKRPAIIYDNLRNWSTYYFQPPIGYSLIAPVVGFIAYDATNTSSLGVTKLKLGAISINFTSIIKYYNANLTPSCVKFNSNGSGVKWANMTKSNLCFTEESGHFSVVIPSTTMTKKTGERWWLVVGSVAGFFGLVLSFVFVMILFKQVKKNKLRRMEQESEKNVALDTVYIGRSVMPRATMVDVYLLASSSISNWRINCTSGIRHGLRKQKESTLLSITIICIGFEKKIKRFHDYGLRLVDDHVHESPLGRL
ncbi:hypothetical protein ACFE04_017692 [Oxalis oulophora]